jgi:hypothetical protein
VTDQKRGGAGTPPRCVEAGEFLEIAGRSAVILRSRRRSRAGAPCAAAERRIDGVACVRCVASLSVHSRWSACMSLWRASAKVTTKSRSACACTARAVSIWRRSPSASAARRRFLAALSTSVAVCTAAPASCRSCSSCAIQAWARMSSAASTTWCSATSRRALVGFDERAACVLRVSASHLCPRPGGR